MKNLPANLARFRMLNGLTLRAVAQELGVHFSMVHHFESGLKNPSVRRLAQLAAVYGVTTDQLIGL